MVVAGLERELIEACQQGNREAFRALFLAYQDKVYSIALRYSGEPSLALDISQDVFVTLFQRIGEFRWESGFDSWLYRLVVNRSLDHQRRARRLVPLIDEIAQRLSSPRDSLRELMRSDVARRVQAAVGRLSPALRMVVVLRYTEGLSYDEIAEAFGCSKGTVASRLNRAHKELARRLASLHEPVVSNDD
ncbi:MAG: sigma-70 family RNA polymerase sigma factor [Bryobacteraceae bacterium]